MGERMHTKGCWLRGSYTVECALVVPIVLGLVFALLYVLFYEHDKLAAQGIMRSSIVACAMEGEEIPVQTEWKRRIQSQLWMGQVVKADLRRSAFSVTGTAAIQLHMEIPVLRYFLEEKQEIDCEIKWKTCNPAQAVRWKGVVQDGA